MKSTLVRPRMLLPLAALAAGCGLRALPSEDDALSAEGQQLAEDTAEAEDSISVASALSAMPAFALLRRPTTLLAAVDAQSRIGEFLLPAGCVTTSREANVVTYTFDRCAGPWARVTISGTEIATFSPGAEEGTLAISMRSEGMTVNNASIQHHAEAQVSFEGDGKHVAWQGGYTGVTARGSSIEHTADLVWGIDASGCVTLNGTTETEIGLRGLSLRYNALQRCGRGDCPTGEIVATRARSGAGVTLAFDGTTEVVATGSNGGERTLTLQCRAE